MIKEILIFTCVIFILTSCKPRECDKPVPDYTFTKGEQAIYIPTGEKVRILSYRTGFGRCRETYNYSIYFPDGSTVEFIKWTKLKPLMQGDNLNEKYN